MKKVIIACLALTALMSLASCSNNATEQEQPIRTVVSSEVTTEAETKPETTTKAEVESDELIFNEQGIEIYFQGIEKNSINLYVVNPSETLPVHAWIQEISINGTYLEKVGCEAYVLENSSNSCRCKLPIDELRSRNISDINELKFNLSVYSGETFIDTIEDLTITR